MLPRAAMNAGAAGVSRRSGTMRRSSELGAAPKSAARHPLMQKESLRKLKREESKDIRAAHRRQLHGPNPGMVGNGQKSFLETRTLTLPRLKSYQKAWEEFVGWCYEQEMMMDHLPDLDLALTNRLNELFFEGADVATAATLQAAVKYFRDDVPKLTLLPRSQEAMKGFRKLEPAQGRVPMPWPMVCFVVRQLWEEFKEAALWILLIWGTCSRPGELFKLRKKHLVAPSKMCRHWVVILSPGVDCPGAGVGQKRKMENGESAQPVVPSKVGELDEAILLDQPYLQGLGKLMAEHVKFKQPQDKIFTMDPKRATSAFTQAIVDEGYQNVGINCTYQLRHGSASTDVLDGLRSLAEVQKRGRWQAQKSVRRYSNGGRVSQVFAELSDQQKANALAAEAWMAKIFASGDRAGKATRG